ncbi:MAG: HAD-IIB family hydrolase, partial [Lentisphaerae bacterium]|nr:HAD-IIB family hydrolase [Lentisphaerota bacterium]
IAGLINAYGADRELPAIANLAVFAGIRRDIAEMDENECEVLTELLLLMDKYDLYGKMAIPKRHDFEYEVPELYRIAARTGGVFVNPAFTEPFGLTLIEAAASGLPIVATHDGGPRDIVQNCDNGVLVDVSRPEVIAAGIKRLLTEPALWRKCSESGVLGVHQHYTWDRHCRRYVDLLSGLNTGKPTDMRTTGAPAKVGRRLTAVKRLFVTDIDETLVGDKASLDALARLLAEHRDTVGFGVATGRNPENAVDVLRTCGVPDPDVVIGAVGTEIGYGANLKPDRGWQTHLAAQWDPDAVREVLSGFSALTMQPRAAQRRFKISYFFNAKDSDLGLADIHAALRGAGVRYNLIYSGGKYLDILPRRGSKGKAIRYLQYKWSIPLNHVLVAGDSGNDADMLRGEVLGVVVANHQPELEAMRGRRKVYFASKPYAAGIREGMERYGFLKHDHAGEARPPARRSAAT